MGKANIRQVARHRRQNHIRKKVKGSSTRPRLTVFRTSKHIYAQLIDDSFMIDHKNRYRCSKTLLTCSTLNIDANGGNVEGAKIVGTEIAKRALEMGIDTVIFDRNGFLYHGRVAALADAAREVGLKF